MCVFLNVIFVLGPWAVGDIVSDLIGWVFPWGIYVKGKLIKDSFIYAYGFGQVSCLKYVIHIIYF